MPENIVKCVQDASPVARSGGGDISQRELNRERNALQTTPPTRVQPCNPKKQLLSTPINKFTAKRTGPASATMARLKTCLNEYLPPTTPTRGHKIGPKAISMEDLTPSKRVRRERKRDDLSPLSSPCMVIRGDDEEEAAARIWRFMIVSAWRRRRHDVKCLRKTLEFQVCCSERLRIQVATLKSLLDSDNAKVRLAIKELERLKHLLRDKEHEKSVLEREKLALEGDVCAAEDKASEMSIGWHNCRNELEGMRAATLVCEHALSLEKAASAQARDQRDQAYNRLSLIEEELAQHEALLADAEAEVSTLHHVIAEKQRALDGKQAQLETERQARLACSRECLALGARAARGADEARALRGELAAAQEMLAWWPRPLTRLMGAARSLFRYPISLPEAVLWSLVPARHGC